MLPIHRPLSAGVSDDRNIIGPTLRELRKRLHVTQKDLSARLEVQGLNIDQAMISRIEKGERPVMDYELVAIARALKIKSAELLCDDDR